MREGSNLAIARAWAVTAAVLAVCLAGGCESSKRSEHSIVVTPSSTTLEGGEGSVLLTASAATNATEDLFLPLEWSVANPSLGNIHAQGGVTAVYIGSGKLGSNPIVVKDQGKSEGVAVVYQGAASTTQTTTAQ